MASFSTQIQDDLFLASEANITTGDKNDTALKSLKRDGITHILLIKRRSKAAFESEGISYEIVELDDKPHEDFGKQIDRICNFIDAAKAKGEKVLVVGDPESTCSRATAAVVSYLMCSKGITYSDAAKEVAKKRKEQFQTPVQANHGFVRQIRTFEKELAKTKPLSKS